MKWILFGAVLGLVYGIYMYRKVFFLAHSRICEDRQVSKFVWYLKTFVNNVDGTTSKVFGFKSVDNEVNFFIYLKPDDPRVEEFENKKELLAFVDYMYLEDYFLFSKKKVAFRELGNTPFAMVSNISGVELGDLDVFEHVDLHHNGYMKIPFSKERAKNILKAKIGVPKDVSELLYHA